MPEQKDQLPVPRWFTKRLFDQFNQVRDSGLVNMFDYHGVLIVAAEMGLNDLVSIEKEEYGQLLKLYERAERTYYPEGAPQSS